MKEWASEAADLRKKAETKQSEDSSAERSETPVREGVGLAWPKEQKKKKERVRRTQQHLAATAVSL